MADLDTPHDLDAAEGELLRDWQAAISALRFDAARDSLAQVPYLHVPAGLPLHAIREAACRREVPGPSQPNTLPTAAASAPPGQPGDPAPSSRTEPHI